MPDLGYYLYQTTNMEHGRSTNAKGTPFVEVSVELLALSDGHEYRPLPTPIPWSARVFFSTDKPDTHHYAFNDLVAMGMTNFDPLSWDDEKHVGEMKADGTYTNDAGEERTRYRFSPYRAPSGRAGKVKDEEKANPAAIAKLAKNFAAFKATGKIQVPPPPAATAEPEDEPFPF